MYVADYNYVRALPHKQMCSIRAAARRAGGT